MLDVVSSVFAFPGGAPASSQDGQRRVSPDVGHSSGDEADLVRAAQAGDRSAFAVLIERYWDRLYRWLCRLTRDGPTAEDITQETFLKAYAAVNSFRPGSNFRAWLFRIAHNNFVNQRRATRHNRRPLVPEVAEDPRGPVAETLSRETIRIIADAVAKLPSDFRGALTLRVEEGLSFRVIAEVHGNHRRDGPVAGVQGPSETDGGVGPGVAPHRPERANVIMNCASARNRLLALLDPAEVPDVVAGHLAACATRSAWHSLLVQVDAVVVATSIPASDGRAKAQVLSQFATAPVIVKPAKANGKSSTKLRTPAVVVPKTSPMGERLARLWPAGLVAAAVLVGALSWVILGGNSKDEQKVAAANDPMLEKVIKAKVDLDTADSSPARLKVLDRLAAEIHDHATTLSKAHEQKEMELLAVKYEQVVMEALVPTARSLSEDERKTLLPVYSEALSKAEQEATRSAAESPVGSKQALQDIARAARAGREQLSRMFQKGRAT